MDHFDRNFGIGWAMKIVDRAAFGRRVASRRAKLKMSQAALAEAVGMKQQGIVAIEHGDVSRPRMLREIAAALRTTQEWLLWEDGPEEADSPPLIRPGGPERSEVEVAREGWPNTGEPTVEVRGVSVGGSDAFFYMGDIQDLVKRPPGIRHARNVVALYVTGSSMEPRFRSGELIYIQDRMPAPGDDVVVELHPEKDGDPPKSFLKELVKLTPRHILCKQHNPARAVEFDRAEVRKLWRVLTLRELMG
ncbi:XRE family transcriptional regulator [Rhodoplanes roseus]|uniref:XRE family transcriptional regulator n=1 Tax=Rhodoplanes roseus TaxID=29409 RepID=UPI0014736BB7|nr:helix-turn-helix domain-containing protein [Rhodoplanes roseus]